jgi:iron(III) transport system ATP-binding protein
MSESVAVELVEVEKRYGPVVAVQRLSLTIPAGELVTLLGPSGCGKTTTLRMIAGLEVPSAGAIRIAGEDVTRLSASERQVSMVFQSYALFPHLTVLENVAYGLVAQRLPRAQALARAEEGLSRVGLAGLGARHPGALSGGQQQRVAVARALVLEPKVLLVDEPLSNLDARLRRQLRDQIRRLQQELGLTAVYVTHDQEEALSVSDRIVLMEQGSVAQQGPPRVLYEAPNSAFVARFIGEANLLPARIVEVRAGVARVDVAGLELSIEARGLEPGAAQLAVRPRSVLLSEEQGGAGLGGTVTRSTYLGHHVELTVGTEAGELFAIAAETERPWLEGARVRVTFAARGVALLPRA